MARKTNDLDKSSKNEIDSKKIHTKLETKKIPASVKTIIKTAEKNIKTLYFRDAGIKEIKNNPHITEVHNWGEIYKYIHMYNNEINS